MVGEEKSAQLKKLYPRSITQSRKTARQIETFLKSNTGKGAEIAIPKVKG